MRAEAEPPGARPGLILFVQSFGDLVIFNPHVHVLAADGAFLPDGAFAAVPPVPEGLLAEGFRRAALQFLTGNKALSGELRAKLLGWRHFGGFSAHNQVRVGAQDAEGRRKLLGYMLRASGARAASVRSWPDVREFTKPVRIADSVCRIKSVFVSLLKVMRRSEERK